MRITEKEVRYVADLANLSLSADEITRMTRDLDEILTLAEKLNELDTDGVEPMAQVLAGDSGNQSWRDDIERPSLPVDVALANAPAKGSGHFKVPKVIER